MATETKTNASSRQSSIGVVISITPEQKVTADATIGNEEWAASAGLAPAVSDIPDLGAAPEQIDVTTIGATKRAYIQGIKDPGALEFTCFYDDTHYGKLAAAQKQDVKVTMSITMKDGLKIEIKGKVSVAIAGFGVGDALTYTLSITPSENIKYL